MLKLVATGGVIDTDDFFITYKTSGLDELTFSISVHDANYTSILEESIIEYEQPYLVKAIDAGADSAKVKCQLDIDALKATMHPDYNNNSATLSETITDVLPTGWLFLDNSYSSIKRTIKGGYTPYDIIVECANTYDVVFRFDIKRRRIMAYKLNDFEPLGAFASTDLNLREVNYKGKSTTFYTRLYAYGKKGLSFADINGGKPYVDNNQYTDKVVCAYWQDDRYEDKESLLDDSKERVKVASIPERSYECNVTDLAKTNPEMYAFQDFALFAVVKLIDDTKSLSVDYQVVEYKEYPVYPERNVITLSSTAPKIQNTVKDIQKEITDKNSGFWDIMHNAIGSATDWITGVNGGYVIFHKDENDIPYEILVMDTPDIATAKNVWRWNQNGFGHSSNGYNGPYDLAMTIDGAIVANFVTTGTMLADRIRGGTLDVGGSTGQDGVIRVFNIDKREIGRWDKNGLDAKEGNISGTGITLGGASGNEGFIRILDADGNEIGRWDKNGLDAKAGNISGAGITLGGVNNISGILKLLGVSGQEITRMDNRGIESTGQISSENPNNGLSASLYQGRIYLSDESGETTAIISYLNEGLTLQAYGGKSAHVVLKRNGDVRVNAMGNMSITCAGHLTVNGRETKSGRAVFSDGSYMDFEKGAVIGGNTTEGGGF